MNIKQAAVQDAIVLSNYYQENASHLTPWERTVEDGFHDIDAWELRLETREKEQVEGRSAYFLTYLNDSKEIIATCSLTGITQGAFMACFMGYSVAKAYEGQGVMKKLCQHAINYAFTELQLNRVMANYMPSNERSEKLLTSLGFVKEGFAKKYLFINGRWEDHIMTSLLNPIIEIDLLI
jgi:[ribosomal protein S5]-alanine N-acetyltransferase